MYFKPCSNLIGFAFGFESGNKMENKFLFSLMARGRRQPSTGLLLPLPPALSSFSSARPVLAPDGLVPAPLAPKPPSSVAQPPARLLFLYRRLISGSCLSAPPPTSWATRTPPPPAVSTPLTSHATCHASQGSRPLNIGSPCRCLPTLPLFRLATEPQRR